MSATSRRRIVLAIVPALLLTQGISTLAAEGVDLRRQAVVEGDAQLGATKSAVCSACHGPDGNSLVSDFPSLAGQSATYLYLQLRAFKTDSRVSDIMQPQVVSLGDEDFRDLAAYYASLSPKASSSAAGNGTIDAGKSLFMRGDVTRGIPPCQGCHGSTARGVHVDRSASGQPATAWHTYPALAGQQAPYVVARLRSYKAGTSLDSTNDRIMHAAVQGLDDQAMQQIAAYVSTLPLL